MWHACPASWSHSMIVRRLCVTPAVGSLMQWLLTRRNRTTTQSTNVATVSQRRNTECNQRSTEEMSQESRQTTLQEQTQQLLQGPLKHIRGAALAAALLPLASVAATPAAAAQNTM